MTTQTIYRALCDAPYCLASGVVERISEVPEGWTSLDSRHHLDGKPAPMVGRGRYRRPVATWDLLAGGFSVELCPEHGEVFGDHHPQTRGGESGRDGQRVYVGCSCDWSGGSVLSARLVGRKPTSTVEAAWVQHLPEGLRWYVTREPRS